MRAQLPCPPAPLLTFALARPPGVCVCGSVGWSQGLCKALALGWLERDELSPDVYSFLTKADLSWMVPGKILAFSSPSQDGLVRRPTAVWLRLLPSVGQGGVGHRARPCLWCALGLGRTGCGGGGQVLVKAGGAPQRDPCMHAHRCSVFWASPALLSGFGISGA